MNRHQFLTLAFAGLLASQPALAAGGLSPRDQALDDHLGGIGQPRDPTQPVYVPPAQQPAPVLQDPRDYDDQGRIAAYQYNACARMNWERGLLYDPADPGYQRVRCLYHMWPDGMPDIE